MIPLLFLLLAAAPARSQDGATSFEPVVETPLSTAAAPGPGLLPAVLVWVPREDTFDLEQVLSFLEQRPSVGLTVAVSPAALAYADPEVLARIPSGLELALRLSGDPVLPLIKDLPGTAGAPGTSLPGFARPGDVVARMTGVRAGYPALPREPAGFVPAAGALTDDLLPLLAPFRIRWTAAGTASPAAPWTGPGGVAILPLRPLGDAGAWLGPQDGPAAWVLDNTADPAAPGLASVREAMDALEGQGVVWLTVSDYLADPSIAGPLAAEVPAGAPLAPWTGNYAPWTSQPLQRAAWDLLTRVARDVDAAQASALVPSRKAEAAARELQNAENGRFFLSLDRGVPASLREAAEREFRVTLQGVYRLLGSAAPDELQRPLGEDSGEATAGTSPVESGEDWVVFRDAAGDALSPWTAGDADAPGPVDLEAVRVWWQDGKVTFSVSLSSGGLEDALVDLYIDMNRRPGAGVGNLLPDRQASVEASDAWEFALQVTAASARLYQSGPQGQILEVGPLPVQANAYSRTMSVSVSTKTFRGDPKLWGYVGTVMALDRGRSPSRPSPRKGPDGTVLLDILSPWTADPKGLQRRRLEAVRAQ